MKEMPKRLFIKTKDVALIMGFTDRQARNRIKEIKETLQKEKHQLITVVEFAKFEGITVDDVEPYLI
jgi:transcriptional antiterminator